MLADDKLAEETTARGKRFCDEQAWDRVAERHVALYQSILDRKR
jgi:hypothetical protein